LSLNYFAVDEALIHSARVERNVVHQLLKTSAWSLIPPDNPGNTVVSDHHVGVASSTFEFAPGLTFYRFKETCVCVG
jgi:hypothetical protein